jgi:hypothetical protein
LQVIDLSSVNFEPAVVLRRLVRFFVSLFTVNRESVNVAGCPNRINLSVAGRHHLLWAFSTVFFLSAAGCGSGGPKPVNPKQVVPVTGIVHVDGEPNRGLKVRIAPDPMPADGKVTLPTIGRCDDEGKFSLTTYYQDDGAPIGEFSLLFELDMNPSGSKQDFFRGKYSNPRASQHKLSVKGDEESIDLEVIELTSP